MIRRISNLLKGFFGLFISGLEKRNPEALLELERENLRQQITQFNQGLATHAGLCEKLITQVRRLEQEESDLKARATANLRAGNERLAAGIAFALQKVRRELSDNRAQAEDAEKTYKDLIQSRDTAIKAAREKINLLARDLDDLKMKKALAQMSEVASGLLTQIGGSGDTLQRLHSMVEDERHRAAGRVRIARDGIETHAFREQQAEREALEDQALADLVEELRQPALPAQSAQSKVTITV